MALKKPTKFVASHPILLEQLKNKTCLERHSHGKVTAEAERWPLRLCTAIATGIAVLLCERCEESQRMLVLPTFGCLGCRGHVRRDDPRHVRDETCKYKDEASTEWTCKKYRHRSDTRHTLGPDCRWAIASTRTEGAGRARRGHHPRDPAAPASSDPTSRLKLPEEHPSQVESEAVEPEVLTQAAARRRAKHSIEVQAGHDPDLVEASDVLPDSVEPSTSSGSSRDRAPSPSGEGVVDEGLAPLPEAPSWSKFELGTALQLLRSVRPGVVRRTLRRLRIRWYLAPANATLLSAWRASLPMSCQRVISVGHGLGRLPDPLCLQDCQKSSIKKLKWTYCSLASM